MCIVADNGPGALYYGKPPSWILKYKIWLLLGEKRDDTFETLAAVQSYNF